jgi:hypothetical protein
MTVMGRWVSSVPGVAAERVRDEALWTTTAKCMTCGASLEDAAQTFCGGDRCDRVWMRRATFEFSTEARTVCRR